MQAGPTFRPLVLGQDPEPLAIRALDLQQFGGPPKQQPVAETADIGQGEGRGWRCEGRRLSCFHIQYLIARCQQHDDQTFKLHPFRFLIIRRTDRFCPESLEQIVDWQPALRRRYGRHTDPTISSAKCIGFFRR